MIVHWCRTQASCHISQGVVDDRIYEPGVRTAGPGRSEYSTVEWTRAEWLFTTLLTQHSSPVVRVKLRILISSMIMRNVFLSASTCSNFQVRPREHTNLQAAVRLTNTALTLFLAKDLSSMSCVSEVM